MEHPLLHLPLLLLPPPPTHPNFSVADNDDAVPYANRHSLSFPLFRTLLIKCFISRKTCAGGGKESAVATLSNADTMRVNQYLLRY